MIIRCGSSPVLFQQLWDIVDVSNNEGLNIHLPEQPNGGRRIASVNFGVPSNRHPFAPMRPYPEGEAFLRNAYCNIPVIVSRNP
jgi:hypothetical protein